MLACGNLLLHSGGCPVSFSVRAGERLRISRDAPDTSRLLFQLLACRRQPPRRTDTYLRLNGQNLLGATAFECSRRGVQLAGEPLEPIKGLTLRQNLQLSAADGLFRVDEVFARLPRLVDFAEARGELIPPSLYSELSLARVLVRPTQLLLVSGSLPISLAMELADRGVSVIFGAEASVPNGLKTPVLKLPVLSAV